MAERCPTCDALLVEGLCLTCDVAQAEAVADVEVAAEAQDPLVGRLIAGDRYEIRSLHSTGGMARIYRGVQRSLDREVVIKVILPELLAQDELTADEAVQRFMVEARAASALNHPNVVSVYDFGQTSPADGGQLFMVMEYLSGPDLWTVHHRQDPEMAFPRIAAILKQTLAALGEAHHLGMAHRDIKPENIILETTRSGQDLVKVIDFGLAKLSALQSVTRAGQTLGTPHYMAPEQIAGGALGSGDLYAVGVILFELLTGQVPFDGANPVEILRKHISAPRPDPRDVAPHRNIPAALATVAMRAIDIDPQNRWPDAESLSAAIVRAVGSAEWTSRASMPDISLRSSSPFRPLGADRADDGGAYGSRPSFASKPPSVPRPASRPRPFAPPLVGRDGDLAWARTTLAGRRSRWMALHGAAGVGRTRLLGDIAGGAEASGVCILRLRGGPSPRDELRYSGLRAVVSALTVLPENEPRLASGAEAGRDADAAAGLRAAFADDLGAGDPAAAREAAAAAFAWAAGRVVDRASGAPVLLAVDDIDRLDNASRLALRDGFARAPAGGFFLLTTSETPLGARGEITERRLAGLSGIDATRMAEWLGSSRDMLAARRAEGGIEPLYVSLARAWRLDAAGAPPPPRLLDLVQLGLRGLSPSQRRLLVAVAVTGGGLPDDLAAAARRSDLDGALAPLVDQGILEVDAQGEIHVTHAILARVALDLTPAAALAQLHGSEAERLVSRPALAELRAYHAVRGQPDFETFLLVEQCAALRAAAGDDAGVVSLLEAALEGGRALLRHGDLEAGGSACAVFGQKLGAALRAAGRDAEAIAVLESILGFTAPGDRARALVLEEIARSQGSLGKVRDAAARRQQALVIARKLGDRELVQRLVAAARE